MGYTVLKNHGVEHHYRESSLEGAALRFIRERCEGLRFSEEKTRKEKEEGLYLGTSLKENQIPYNMQMDIDRLCLERSIDRFLGSGRKEDAFDIYFCYLEMFIGDYEKTRRMIELLSEFEMNGSRLLMKHRDHYSHSVYVFVLGLAIYETNSVYRKTYNEYYHLTDEHQAACHYLQYWGLAALFHDIGYPFELPFEQVESYFEVNGQKRNKQPYIAYHALDSFRAIEMPVKEQLKKLYDGRVFETTDEVFAYVICQKLSKVYPDTVTEQNLLNSLREKPAEPDKFNFFMDHAYFSATVLFKKLFDEMECKLNTEYMDALTAILMHNSLYKFSIAKYKNAENKPFRAKLHPLAYMLMLCDELQCWDRTAYGRNSKTELHPMGCEFLLDCNTIHATYLFDEKEIGKVEAYQSSYEQWLRDAAEKGNGENGKQPELKAYSKMYAKNKNGISEFQEDIERIVDLTEIKLQTEITLKPNRIMKTGHYLSNSNFINLYHFAAVLNGRWASEEWRKAKEEGFEEQFILNSENTEKFMNAFKKLSLEYKLSNINQAKAFARYMDQIGCFYTDQSVDFEMVEQFSEEDLLTIGQLEHQRWLQEHYDMGWEYGEPERDQRELMRQHKDMLPEFDFKQEIVTVEQARENYKRLNKEEQDKDTKPMECMLAMLKMFDGLRIYRLNV